MHISEQEVQKVAVLARLDLAEDKIQLFAKQMDNILGYMDKLNELDTSEIEPMYSPVEHHSVLREDIERKEYNRDQILANAPENDGQYFMVPKIV